MVLESRSLRVREERHRRFNDMWLLTTQLTQTGTTGMPTSSSPDDNMPSPNRNIASGHCRIGTFQTFLAHGVWHRIPTPAQGLGRTIPPRLYSTHQPALNQTFPWRTGLVESTPDLRINNPINKPSPQLFPASFAEGSM